jgi:hypothetical protein
VLDDLRLFARYAGGLRAFLATTTDAEACRRLVLDQRARRADHFVRILERGVFAHARSPYRRLLDHAGVTLGDAAALVRDRGVEGALGRLYDVGVRVSIDEFKGRTPIVRGSLRIPVAPGDFDNPLPAGHYETRTGGSRGPRTRLVVDLDLLAHEAAETRLFLEAFGAEPRPVGIWRDPLPGPVGIKTFLRHTRIGSRVTAWFTPRRQVARLEDLKYQVFMLATAALSGWSGRSLPRPRHVPPSDAWRIAEWLAHEKRRGQPALLDTNTSAAVRVCLAARDRGLDIAGSLFRVSAEPYTPAKATVINERGCRTASHYSCAEVGYMGLACASPAAVDEVHVMTDKVAVIQRQRTVGLVRDVGALFFTTVLPSCPKLMLNVELGDYATLTRRQCGCLLDTLGFDLHLHDVRSWEKLNSAGVTFLGTELIAVVEEVLPGRFGGTALDYQFVEEEVAGLPVVVLRVHPRLPGIDGDEVVAVVLTALRACPGGGVMADNWRANATLRVDRRAPITSGAFKLLPLHLAGTSSEI